MVDENYAANLIRTIVEQRNQLTNKNPVETFLESATQQSKHILSFGLNIAVHILLAPSNCQCQQKSTCKKAIEFEVWTIKLEKIDNNASTILPTFFQQAIFSQLHFSPFNAWLSDNFNGKLPQNYQCIYKLSTDSKFSTSAKTEAHSFPCCFVDRNNQKALKIEVEWLCKNEFVDLEECLKEKKLNIPKSAELKDENIINENIIDDNIIDRNIIDDCPIQRDLTEKQALNAFTASSSNKYPHLLLDKKKRIRRNTTGSELRENYNGSPVPWQHGNIKSPQSSSLLCNFEESALKGHLQPINSLNGFKLQLITQDRFNNSLEIPITAYYFNEASLYLGNCNLSKPIRISKNSTIQASIFNPQGSVIKIFILPIKIKIPPNSKTFVRQRTYCMPKNVAIEEAQRSWLRYLIHFRLVTDNYGRLFMHTEIKMLFANKADVDMDVQNLVSGQDKYHLVTKTEEPSGYSAIK